MKIGSNGNGNGNGHAPQETPESAILEEDRIGSEEISAVQSHAARRTIDDIAQNVTGKMITYEPAPQLEPRHTIEPGYLKLYAAILDSAIRDRDVGWITDDEVCDASKYSGRITFALVAAALKRDDPAFREQCLREMGTRAYARRFDQKLIARQSPQSQSGGDSARQMSTQPVYNRRRRTAA